MGAASRCRGIFDGLTKIGIDETSYKRGYKYMSVVVNHEDGNLVWARDKHGKDVLREFFELLTPEQRSQIQFVTGDGASWIKECVEEYCPSAKFCLDPFHVVQWATEALDSLRREKWHGAKRELDRVKKGLSCRMSGYENPRRGSKLGHLSPLARSY
jgi:transposase